MKNRKLVCVVCLVLMLAMSVPASAYEKWGAGNATKAPQDETESLYGMWKDSKSERMLGFYHGRIVYRDDENNIYWEGRYTITGGVVEIDMAEWPYCPTWTVEKNGKTGLVLTSADGDGILLFRKNWLR